MLTADKLIAALRDACKDDDLEFLKKFARIIHGYRFEKFQDGENIVERMIRPDGTVAVTATIGPAIQKKLD